MYEPLFCECCGQSIAELRKEIEENGVSVVSGSKQLKCGKHFLTCGKHYLTESGEVYSYSIYMDYCSDCGAKLEYEDYKLIHESHPWGSTTVTETLIDGYRCHACGYETEV